MNTYLECLPCFLSQALRAARITTDDELKIRETLDEIGMMIRDIPFESSPPETGRIIYRRIREITGDPDPYLQIKKESTRQALLLYPALKSRVENSDDRLLTAIKIAIAGNIIDYGIYRRIDIIKDVEEALERDFALCDYSIFKKRLNEASEILFLGDNAGECVFDRVLIEELHKPVTYAVRGTPIINDATCEDALHAGIDRVARILSSGTDAPGTVLSTCSEEFMEIYGNSRFIISKGQGNYEALSSEKRPISFLFKAKCSVVAEKIGVNEGDIVLI